MDKLKKLLLSNDAESSNFRCSLCYKFLSVKPILYCSTIGNICGRCEADNTQDGSDKECVLERQTIFENIIQHLDFPCSYYRRGCKITEIKSEDIMNHEAACTFRSSTCPFGLEEFLEDGQDECIWKGCDKDLAAHLKSDHAEYFSDPPQICLAPEFRSKLICVKSSNEVVFLIMLIYQKKSYKYNFHIYADYPINQCKQYTCDIDIMDANKRYSIQTEHCKPLSFGLTIDDDDCLEIDIYSIKELFKKPAVTMTFNIKMKGIITHGETSKNIEKCVDLEQNVEMIIDELDEEFKERITCDSCKKYLIPPIFSCVSGHNNCYKCYQTNSDKCICSKGDLVENNFTLDLISRGLNYPCLNKGCSYRGPILKLREHEEVCVFALRKCLFECQWEGDNYALFQHVQESHGFLEMNEVTKLQLNSKSCHMLHFDKKLFFLVLRYEDNDPFKCNMFCYGDQMILYKYDIVLIGSTAMGIKITLSHICQPIMSFNVSNKSDISIPFQCLKQFVSNTNNLRFKINISKIKN